MSTAYDVNVQLRRPPGPAAGSTTNKMQSDSTSGAGSTSAKAVTAGRKAYVEFFPTQSGAVFGDLIGYFVMGASTVGPATTNDRPLFHGVSFEYLCLDQIDTHMRIIRAGATDITVKFFVTDADDRVYSA